ncbi:MAG: Mutator mutT protein [Candidatus Daviesbacteria bacterium GW2011_GWA1_41_61]|uniref:Mutator mutT protein n=1 Tax=Candidatus Daviesbacteria bacterium GW2011_GWA2_40_9 TaxID=1618424 RepID=A0A0G0U1G1_9BACT|nr:MAG: Mutator mutT protein [Candidatus Daviesbacteria bacterium GW2011_GWC1_40_9]KKR82949.1 MAG: Mutator mutT protein [Candidatus Daviesbacteria bacterium GW2011_GWA2_40_9]KKR92876.1 MAG: Mutator mutT protein [Candidatus Daviesbacteria bacterium GW2011_GWB1_41_15]KKS15420.1 MAG: Mutator mutT protein [Candidatus Daviesbacteria bacterium GW2011_GWA1_41_61]
MNSIPIVVIIVRNDKGKFFVHQRSSHKKNFPNKYGLGAGGHINEGEKPEEATRREFFEETGLTTPVKYLFDINYQGDDFIDNELCPDTAVLYKKYIFTSF